jgi:hypothetical protein
MDRQRAVAGQVLVLRLYCGVTAAVRLCHVQPNYNAPVARGPRVLRFPRLFKDFKMSKKQTKSVLHRCIARLTAFVCADYRMCVAVVQAIRECVAVPALLHFRSGCE